MRRPNFFLVGAPRCGTASMYTYLKQHPEIYVSIDKEPHFFGSDLGTMPGTIREENLYLSLFAGAGDRPRIGEASVWYLSSRRAPHEIRAFAPDARILILLREPAQMAHSLYSLYARTGNEDLPSFEEALAAEPERQAGRRLPPGAYFPQGLLYTAAARYAGDVERYFTVFGRENVHCVLFDDFVRDTPAAYRQTLAFLGVDPGFQAELDRRRAAERVRLQAILQLRRLAPEVRSRIQFKEMQQHAAAPRQPLAPATAARLRGLFAEDVARLGRLLGRDLGAWTRGESVPPAGEGGEGRPRLRRVFDSVRALRRVPPELRGRHDQVESLERKFARWQTMRVPELALDQQPANPAWPAWFAAERERIAGTLGPLSGPLRIEHFGSTSVPGLSSKNVIDMAVGLAPGADAAAAAACLAELGYEGYGNSPVDPETVWLWRIADDRAFCVHLGDRGRPWIDEQVDMRDYLAAHPEERDRYAAVKRRLAEERGQGLLQYSMAKLATTMEMVEKARKWRGSGAFEARPLDHQALVGAGADDAGRGRDLDLEAEQPALRDLDQPDAHGHLLPRAGGADVGDVDAGADRGLALAQAGLDGRQAGVLDEGDHARGREDARDVRGAHVRGDQVGRLAGQAGAQGLGGHGDELI